MISKIIPSIIVLFSLSSVRCFVVDTNTTVPLENSNNILKKHVNAKNVEVDSCTSMNCSNKKVQNMYNNSKYLLSEIEMLLQELRDHKISHEIELEQNKKLDNDTLFVNSKDFMKMLYKNDDELENEHSFDDHYNDDDLEDITEAVPFVHGNYYDNDNDNQNENEEDQDKEEEKSEDEELIDLAFSKLYAMENNQNAEVINEEIEKKPVNKKRYLR